MKNIQLTNLSNNFNKRAKYKLGTWCVNYKNYNDNRNKIIDYHWNNRKKLYKDYFYLKRLKKKILVLLTDKLNRFHKSKNNIRYWQILLDPYLSYIISTFFDRWEIIGSLKEKYFYVNYDFKNKNLVFEDTEDFINNIISNDYVNQFIFQEIIKFRSDKKLNIYKNININKVKKKKNKKYTKKSFLKEIFAKRNKVLFFDTYFNSKSFTELNLKLKQLPLNLKVKDIFHKEKTNKKINFSFRKNLLSKFKAKNEFENFLKIKIGEYLLKDVIEDYSSNLEKVYQLELKPKIIISSGMHSYSPIFKQWIACSTKKNIKFFIAEHGGSLPEPSHFFDYEEEISNKVLTWHKSFLNKQFQLPAQKLIYQKKIDYKKNKKCLLITNRVTRYSFRAEFYPLTGNNFNLINFYKKVFRKLHPDIKHHTLIKLHPYDNDTFWNNKKIFINFAEKKRVITDVEIKKLYKKIKLAICLYPETTFAETITMNIPTILIYPKNIYETHFKTKKIIDKMKKEKIIFNDADVALNHINKIWKDPSKWWEEKNLQNVVNKFKIEILGLSAVKNNINIWKKFLNNNLQ